jgi:hypothetical protein
MSMTRAIRTAVLTAASLLGACGGSKPSPPGLVGTGSGSDAAVVSKDASPAPAADAGAQPPPPVKKPPAAADAGHDAGVVSPPPPSDEDAGPHCTGRECRAMGDQCNVGYCDPAAGECKLEPKPDGTACGSGVLDNCTAPDTCEAGVCAPRDSPQGTPCGDHDVVCHLDDECDGSGQCVDRGLAGVGAPCGDRSTDTECDKLDSCDALGVCQPNYAAADAPCGDHGKLCSYDDACDGQGHCIDNGVWTLGQCPSGSKDEPADGQRPAGCLCGGETLSVCRFAVDVCVAGTCMLGSETDGTPCGDTATNTECNKPDACVAGTCSPSYAQSGAPCGNRATDTACDRPDACDGNGSCDPQYASTTTACGSAAGECFIAPLCDGTGGCRPTAPAASGTMCGDPLDTECNHADTCNGAGVCQSNFAPSGTACGDQGLTCANDDSCNAAGVCVDHGVTSPCAFSGTVFGGNGLAGVVVETLGSNPVSTTTDSNGNFQIALPLLVEVALHVGSAPGYFGNVELRTFTPVDAEHTLELYPSSDANLNAAASAVGLTLDAGKGAVVVTIDGSSVIGSEGASLSSASALPITQIGSAWQYSNTIMSSGSGFLLFHNVTVGATTVSPVSAAGETCAVDAVATQFPVLAHTVSNVRIACQ